MVTTLVGMPDPFQANDEVIYDGASYEVFDVLDNGDLILARGWDMFPVRADEVRAA